MAIDSIPHRLAAVAAEHPERPAYYAKVDGSYRPTSYRTYNSEVRTAARALVALGFEPGHTVSILGFNRPEWAIFDLGAMAAGGAAAGIYTTCSPEEVQYIIAHSESRIVLLEDDQQLDKVREQADNLPDLDAVVLMRGTAAPRLDTTSTGKLDDLDGAVQKMGGLPRVLAWDDFLALADTVDEEVIDTRLEALTDDQLATFIYTSGTTGPPKGVMLSHRNLSWTAAIIKTLIDVDETDCSVSYLPLSHIAEQMFTLHSPITHGYAVYYAESIDRLPDNLKEVQPTIVFGVPRIWEKFHAGVNNKLKDAPPLRQRLVAWAMEQGRAVIGYRNRGESPPAWLMFKHRVADRLIYSKLKPALGLANARYCVSGAAPISAEVLEWFAGIDIVIHEVYGQSEGSGPTTFNVPGKTKYGTVGPALPGVDVKIAEDGEILAKGPNIFMGYFKDEAATADTLIDGWLYSGDLGAFDDQGFLSITGRKKEIIITAGGKNIAPKNIEAAMKNTPYISEAVVIGDRRKYLSALVTLDEEATVAWAQDNGESTANLHANPKLRAEIQGAIDNDVNALFARVEHIRKFTILDRQLTVDDGELTPTLKVKRKVVNEHFAEQIEAMYA